MIEAVVKIVRAVGISTLAVMMSFGAYECTQSKTGTQLRLKYLRTQSIPVVTLENTPYVENPTALKVIRKGFESRMGGIKVLYAPTGSGKTTLLANLAIEYKDKDRHVEFISCAASKKHLYDCLGIPKLFYNLSEVIPHGTIIIFDQMDSPAFGEEFKNMLREVALDSRKVKNYVVIVCVSNKEVAEKILRLNGNDKIDPLGKASDFRWNSELVSAFVEQSHNYKSWTKGDKQRLVELAVEAGTPGFLFGLEDMEQPTPVSILDNKKIVAAAKACAASWSNDDE